MRPASAGRDFQLPQQPCLGSSKPSCCICSLPLTTLLVNVCAGNVRDFLFGPYLLPPVDWTGQACGLASQVTGPQTIVLLPMGIHKILDTLIASWFWREPYCPYSWSLSQQQTSGRNLEFLSTHINFCCIIVSFGLRSVTVHLTICSTLVENTTFVEYLSGFLNSRLSQTHFDCQWHCKATQLTYSCLTMNLCLFSITSRSFGKEFSAPDIYGG
jgi:hypothetical protein